MFWKILFIPVLFFGLAYAVMELWNWLIPDIFGLKLINYWQALGLFVLSHLLFKGGGFGGPHRHRGGRHWKRRFKKRMHANREEMRERMEKGFERS